MCAIFEWLLNDGWENVRNSHPNAKHSTIRVYCVRELCIYWHLIKWKIANSSGHGHKCNPIWKWNISILPPGTRPTRILAEENIQLSPAMSTFSTRSFEHSPCLPFVGEQTNGTKAHSEYVLQQENRKKFNSWTGKGDAAPKRENEGREKESIVSTITWNNFRNYFPPLQSVTNLAKCESQGARRRHPLFPSVVCFVLFFAVDEMSCFNAFYSKCNSFLRASPSIHWWGN